MAGLVIVAPERMSEMLPVGPVTPVVAFFGWAYLGMSAIAIMALRYRGSFLLGPAVCWSVYFAGATFVHLHSGHGSHGGLLPILLNHGLVSVILVVGMLMRGKPVPSS